MVNQQQQQQQPRPQSSPFWIIVIAVAFWLFFMNGLSMVKQWSASNQAAGVASAIQTGAGRALATAQPLGKLPPAVPPAGAAQPAAPAAGVDTSIAAYNATQVASVPIAAAPVAPAAAVPPVVNNPATWPTAVIMQPTIAPVAQVIVVPDPAKPYHADPPAAAQAAPTMAIPTPLPPAVLDGYTLSGDGKCITVARDGKNYQDCEPTPFTLGAARSVADLMRTGRISGVQVP